MAMEIEKIVSAIYCAAEAALGEKLDQVILYGSYARGDYDAESDVDILVLADIPKEECWAYRKRMESVIDALSMEFDLVISVHILDCETFRRWCDVLPFYQNVIREGVVISA
jgi:predicted nucleotidyltransferase